MPDNPGGDAPADGTPGPGGNAPDLPDAAPDPVQDLLDGIWSVGGDVKDGVGDFISGLAKEIGGGGGGGNGTEDAAIDAAIQTAGFLVDLAGVLV